MPTRINYFIQFTSSEQIYYISNIFLCVKIIFFFQDEHFPLYFVSWRIPTGMIVSDAICIWKKKVLLILMYFFVQDARANIISHIIVCLHTILNLTLYVMCFLAICLFPKLHDVSISQPIFFLLSIRHLVITASFFFIYIFPAPFPLTPFCSCSSHLTTSSISSRLCIYCSTSALRKKKNPSLVR